MKLFIHLLFIIAGSVASADIGGGTDVGNGGDADASTTEEVEKSFLAVKADLVGRLRVIRRNSSFASLQDPNGSEYENKYGQGSKQIVQKFIYGIGVQDFQTADTVDSFVQDGKIQIDLTFTGCLPADQKQQDGWARGDFSNGKICIDAVRMRRIPSKNLEEQIFLLIVHEISHLAGFSEDQAVHIQALMSKHPGMYLPENRDPEVNVGPGVCTETLLRNRIQSSVGSKYWMKKKAELVILLSGYTDATSQRTKTNRFADDAEFLDDNQLKFLKVGFGEVFVNNLVAGGNNATKFEIDTHQGLATNVILHLETDNGILARITSKLGSEAQCEPKILLANVLAAAKVMFGLGSGKSILEIETEIINNQQ